MLHGLGSDILYRREKVSARFRPGMTLIELMIVLVISMIVMGAAFTMYQVNARYYVAQDALLEQQQNLRNALYAIARDVRMAGNGLSLMGVDRLNFYVNDAGLGEAEGMNGTGWFSHKDAENTGIRAIFGQDGGGGGTDTLTVFHADIESAEPLGYLVSDFSTTDTNVTLSLRDAVADGVLNDGDMLAVANTSGDAVLLEAVNVTATSFKIGQRFKPGAALPNASFYGGSGVYRLRDVSIVTYFVDTATNRLMASYYGITDGLAAGDDPFGIQGGPVILANDIEDFQVRYILNGQPSVANILQNIVDTDALSEGQLDNNRWVSAVRLALVSRSPLANESTATWRPISVFNHDVSAQPVDGHQRRILVDTVDLRNY